MSPISTTPSIKDAAKSVHDALSGLTRSIRVHAKDSARDARRDIEDGARRAKAEVKAISARLKDSGKRGTARASEVAHKAQAGAKSAWRDVTAYARKKRGAAVGVPGRAGATTKI